MSCRFSVLFVGLLLTAAVSCRTQVQEEKLCLPAQGAIYVLGQASDCAYYKHALLAYDGHDNASIAHTPDGLPDFCGETVVLMSELTFIDTLPPKVFILASAGLSDADMSGVTSLPVLRPLKLVEETIEAECGSSARVVVLSGLSMSLEGELALEFLAACAQKGIDRVDAIVIDTPAVDADELSESIAECMLIEGEKADQLRALVPSGLKIYDPRRVTACRCYELLWQENAFTHRISLPVSVSID